MNKITSKEHNSPIIIIIIIIIIEILIEMGTNGQSESLNQVTPKPIYYIQRDEYKITNHRRIQHKFHLSGLYPKDCLRFQL